MSPKLPSGTVTFVFTDIEGSTQLLQRSPEDFPALIEAHNAIIREAFATNGGTEVDVTGDGFFYVFKEASQAVQSAAAAQRALQRYPWQSGKDIKVRMGIHTGHARITGSTYIGLDVHKTSRITSAAYGGQVLISSAVADLVKVNCPEDLSIHALGEILLKDIHKPEALYLLQFDGNLKEQVGVPLTRAGKGSLPSRATPLLGRKTQISEVRSLINDPDVRLLTLVGPGGIGKTSLAMEAGRAVMQDFEDGVFAVLLAPVTDPQFVATAIAQALDIFVSTSSSVHDQLLDHLHDKQVLLILDNMEHILGCTPLLVKLLEGCPRLKILVTSRSVLRLSWEREFPVPPLPVGEGKKSLAGLDLPSVVLFIQRAQAVDPHYKPDTDEVKTISAICQKLDGLPLAIELAAARIKVLPPKEILSRLCKSLDILRGGTNDLPERHQAMRHTISWSYNLLKPEEQRLFQWLGVFAGGFSLEGAEAVNLEVNGNQSDGLEVLTALRDQSLIRYVETSLEEPRYMMLETIREYALEKLRETGQYEHVKNHHVRWYSNCAHEASRHFNGSNAREWLDRVELDQDNFRAALKWCKQTGDAETGLALCNAIWRFWVIRGYMQEGISQITAQLEASAGKASPLTRANALNALATLMHEMSDYKGASEILPEAITAFRAAQDQHSLAIALNNLSWIRAQTGFLDDATKDSFEAFELHKANNNKRGMAVAMGNLGFIALSKADFIEMRQYYGRHYTLMAEGGDRRGMAYSLLCQTFAEQDTGRIQECLPKIEEAAQIVKEIEDRQMMAWANTMHAFRLFHARQFEDARKFLHTTVEQATLARNRLVASFELMLIGAAYLKSGDLAQARGYLEEALGYARQRGSKFLSGLAARYCAEYGLKMNDLEACFEYVRECYLVSAAIGNTVRQIDACEILGLLYEARGDYPEAIELLACADHARERAGIPLQPSQSVEIEASLDALQEQVGDVAFRNHWSRGHLLEVEEVLDKTFAIVDSTRN